MKDTKLIDKYNNGGKYGYLTDEEILLLLSKTKTAWDLADELKAGDAVSLYYINFYHRVELMVRARGLECP